MRLELIRKYQIQFQWLQHVSEELILRLTTDVGKKQPMQEIRILTRLLTSEEVAVQMPSIE